MGRRIKTENKEMILKSVYKLFLKENFSVITAVDIAKDSGVNQRSFYRYFNRKEDVLGHLVSSIETQMYEYLKPFGIADTYLNYAVFTIFKYEFSLWFPEYFKLRSNLIKYPDTFIESFTKVFALFSPKGPLWITNEDLRSKLFYTMGGMQMLQYEFLTDYPNKNIEDDRSDFLSDSDYNVLSEKTKDAFRRYMFFALEQNLKVFDFNREQIQSMIDEASGYVKNINMANFRQFYETNLNLV